MTIGKRKKDHLEDIETVAGGRKVFKTSARRSPKAMMMLAIRLETTVFQQVVKSLDRGFFFIEVTAT